MTATTASRFDPRRSRRTPARVAKRLRVLVLMDQDLIPPADAHSYTREQLQTAPWKMEYDVAATLENLGHEVKPLGVHDDLNVIRDAVMTFQPDIAFNLLEGFRNFHCFDQHVVSYLELLNQPYTGCIPRGLRIARD